MSTTASATTPPVRFAALRGRVPLPWVTVAALAVLLAFANGFVIVAIQGAIGAIERAQHLLARARRRGVELLGPEGCFRR